MAILTKKKNDKVSLNIKVSRDLDSKLKLYREAAREQGEKFNVSEQVEAFLNRLVNNAEKKGVFKKKSLFDAKKKVEKKKPKKVEKSNDEQGSLELAPHK